MEWEDPFAQDEAARERERRRAEREARRRERQQSIADKVSPRGDEPDRVSPPPPPPAPAPGPVARPATATATATSRPAGPRDRSLMMRRILGVGALILAAVAVFIAAKAVSGVLGDDDPPPPPTPKAQPTQTITIPEGQDRRQIAALAKKEGLKGDYLEATEKAPRGFPLAEYGAQGAPNLEGFLFPDTWNDLPKKATVNDLIDRQLGVFQERIAGVDMGYAKSKNLTVYDVLKIASMVEREIQVPEERPLAAAVIYNRLAADDTLGIDATIRYYLQNYDEQLTESELADPHPYNTRVNPGLPPTPIGNPGLASIEAAANPAKSDAYFFVVKPGTCGEHVFVETQEEFDQAEAEYQAALQAEGGSPTEC